METKRRLKYFDFITVKKICFIRQRRKIITFLHSAGIAVCDFTNLHYKYSSVSKNNNI